jgi:hypothetical protein
VVFSVLYSIDFVFCLDCGIFLSNKKIILNINSNNEGKWMVAYIYIEGSKKESGFVVLHCNKLYSKLSNWLLKTNVYISISCVLHVV